MYATIVRYMATRTITIFLVTVIHVFFIVYGSKLRNMKTSPKFIAQNSFKTTLKKACETLLIDSYWLFGSSCYAHATLCKSVFIFAHLRIFFSFFPFFIFYFFIFLSFVQKTKTRISVERFETYHKRNCNSFTLYSGMLGMSIVPYAVGCDILFVLK